MKRSRQAPCVLFVNAGRIDFDGALDIAPLEAVADIVRHESDCDADTMVERAAACEPDFLITKEIPVTASAIERLPSSVRMIVEAGTGFNNVHLEAAKARGIVVTNVAGYSSESVAQLVISHVLNFSCSLHLQYAALRRGDTASFTGGPPCGGPRGMPHFELGGKVIGLVGGTGGVASSVRKVALALGMKVRIGPTHTASYARRHSPPFRQLSHLWQVLVYSRSGSAPDGTEAKSLQSLLAESDFVSIHCPLTPDTRGLIDAEGLRSMKPTAYLINTARGGIIDQGALVAALQQTPPQIAGAALDVQEVEPPPLGSPLYELPNVVLTPHIGWKRIETRQRLVGLVAENVRRFLAGDPINVIV